MAESQLVCMEDGSIYKTIPDTKPEFYYSEEQRAALEELLKKGDGAFKTRLKEDNFTDFLSAREIKVIRNSLIKYKTAEQVEAKSHTRETLQERPDDLSSLRSTYWPQMSDTEVPPLDIGWPSGGFFRGVTRVAVYTHPPKDNGPHIKEVVRRLIQGAGKVIAIVMDLLTDLQILRDLLEAASTRSVPTYIVLDVHGVPHFLDMCSRLHIGSQHLKNIRVRTVRGTGFDLSFGRIPGSLCSKYMLIDGDKVAFGSYSYSWTTSRMDRNMITVLSGQIVDTYDRDFRELYAVSDKLDLFKEFSISRPHTETLARVTVPKRSSVSTTSRFQVSLGDLKVPAHKYYNPKYFLAFGDIDEATGPRELIDKMEPEVSTEELVQDTTLAQGGSEETPTRSPNKSTKMFKFFDTNPMKKSKQKKIEGSNKGALEVDEQVSPAPSSAGNPALTSHMEGPTLGSERVSALGVSEQPDDLNTLPDHAAKKRTKKMIFFKTKPQDKNKLKKIKGGNKEALEVDKEVSPAPSPAGHPALTSHMAVPTQGPERVSELGGSEKTDDLNTLPEHAANKRTKRLNFFNTKPQDKNKLKKIEGGNKEALEVNEQVSPAPSPAGHPALTSHMEGPTLGSERVSELGVSEKPDDLNTLPEHAANKRTKRLNFFNAKPQDKNKLKKIEGSSKEALEVNKEVSPTPSPAGHPALTSHMAVPTQGPERVSELGVSEKPDDLNTLPDHAVNKRTKQMKFFDTKPQEKNKLKKIEGGKEALEVDKEVSPAPSPAGHPALTSHMAVPTQGSEELLAKEPISAKAKTKKPKESKGPGQLTIHSQEDQDSKDEEHNQKTCVLS